MIKGKKGITVTIENVLNIPEKEWDDLCAKMMKEMIEKIKRMNPVCISTPYKIHTGEPIKPLDDREKVIYT